MIVKYKAFKLTKPCKLATCHVFVFCGFFHEASFRTSFSKSLDSAINVLHTFFTKRLYFSFQLEAGWWEADVLTQGPGGVASLPDSLSLTCVDEKPLWVH